MLIDGSVMRVKGMLGVRTFVVGGAVALTILQENQLYVFDPKALYNIFVKASIEAHPDDHIT